MPTRRKPGPQAYARTVLDNGIRVVTEKIPTVRSVSIGVWADVGSRDESTTQNGISHFVEHMVFKGTRNRSVREIAQSLESLGGYLNAFTTKEQTCFYARVLDANVVEAVDVLSDIVQNATFRREELEKEKLVVIEELRNAEDDPGDIIHDYLEKAVFPNHSLGFPIIGTEENLRKFCRDDLVGHIQRHFHPTRLVLAAAGNIDHQRFVRLAEKHFGALRLGQPKRVRDAGPLRTSRPIRKVSARSIKQAHVALGTVAYGVKHRDRYPLLVVNALLGEGMSSRLYQTIRETHGMAYTVYSFVNLMSDTGLFGTYLATDKKNIEPAIDMVHKELRSLVHERVPTDELDRTKSQIKGTMMLGLENTSSRMMRLGSGELYFEKQVTLDDVLKKVDGVRPSDIQRVAEDLFSRKRFSTIVIRPD
jgi:predicted Zn-dependent peptidase